MPRTRSSRFILAKSVLAQADIQHLVLTYLDFHSFHALRSTCSEVREATQFVCEDLIQVLERAAGLYISSRFADGLKLIASHQPHISWLLQVRPSTLRHRVGTALTAPSPSTCAPQTPVLAVVAINRYDDLIASSYHLLQVHSPKPCRSHLPSIGTVDCTLHFLRL
jgi:hypothetical protein